MDSPTVTSPTGAVRRVKNFGWFLRHTGDVVYTEFHHWSPEDRSRHVIDGTFRAWLRDGTRYETPYASRSLLWKMLNRCRNLLGVEFSEYGPNLMYRPRRVRIIGGEDGRDSWERFYQAQGSAMRTRTYGEDLP
jgi:hypothetical protein